jgi:hypothetical protein
MKTLLMKLLLIKQLETAPAQAGAVTPGFQSVLDTRVRGYDGYHSALKPHL